MEINKKGGRAIGLSGKDALLAKTKKLIKNKKNLSSVEKLFDLGFVGVPEKINKDFWIGLNSSFIPVISPIGFDNNFKTYNINADTMAGKVSSSIKSERLILLTDVKGVVDKKETY